MSHSSGNGDADYLLLPDRPAPINNNSIAQSRSSSDSDGESLDTSLTTPTNLLDAPDFSQDELYSHFPLIRSTLDNAAITEKTLMAMLFRVEDHPDHPHNRLLQDLSGISGFAARCQVSVGEASWDESHMSIPTSHIRGSRGCDVYFQVINGLTAPAIRIEARFLKNRGLRYSTTKVVHTASLDFHFNDCEGKQLSDFSSETDETGDHTDIKFTANGATCEGFNLGVELSPGQLAVFRQLRSLVPAGGQQKIRLRLFTSEMSHADVRACHRVLERLPGGSGPVLPTIGYPEYSNFEPDYNTVLSPHALMRRTPPLPMVPLHSGPTFPSMQAYQAEMRTSISAPYHENQQELELFASCENHQVALFEVDDFVVIAMKVDPRMARFGNRRGDIGIDLPNEMEVELNFAFPDVTADSESGHFMEVVAFREKQPLGIRKKHDFYFVVTSHDKKWFSGRVHQKADTNIQYATVSAVAPHKNRFLYVSLLEAIADFMEEEFADWHPIMLNQLHDDIPVIDFAAGLPISEAVLQDAKEWLRTCRPWNQQQLEAIVGMHCTKGRVQVICGPAGTGKTTLQNAQALFFVMLGGRALCAATCNTNADHLVRDLDDFIRDCYPGGLRVYRLYAASKGVTIRSLCKAQVRYKKQGHDRDGRVSTLRELMFKMLSKKNAEAIDFSVEAAVLDEAEKCQLQFKTRISDAEGEVDAWARLRYHFKLIKDDNFKWGKKEDVVSFEKTYEACKGHLVGIADIIITTNGNARCHELVTHWGNEDLYGPGGKAFPAVYPPTAVGVFIDEAAKDAEVNILNTLTTPALRRKNRMPDYVALYGDEQQLQPFKSSESEDFQINMFVDRLSISLPGRLIAQNYPNTMLRIQHRMNPAISKNPNEMFYDGRLIDAECVRRDLEYSLPGLGTVLHDIIARTFPGEVNRQAYMQQATDVQARLHWLEMPVVPPRQISFEKGSAAIKKHIDLFMNKVFPYLQLYFGDEMRKKVMIICSYSHAMVTYLDRFREQRELVKALPGPIGPDQIEIDDSYYPRVLTIDASQGQEADMVIVDGSMQWADKMSKHLKDRGRNNVAMTRAKHVLWVIGGPMNISRQGNQSMKRSPFVELKQILDRSGQVHRFGDPFDRYN